MPVDSQLTTAALYEGMQEITTALAGEPVDGAALIAALEAAESGADGAKEKRHREILEYFVNSVDASKLTGNGVVHTPVITTPGTGYVVGDVIPFTDGGDGYGASVRVTQVGGGGEIQAVELVAGGYSYVDPAASDSTGIGNGDAVIDVTVDYDGIEVVKDAIENGDWTAV